MESLELSSSLSEMSEGEFLENQAQHAKAAIAGVARELLDVRTHIRQHPWWAIGAAGLAGVATGRAIHPHQPVEDASKINPAATRPAVSPIIKTIISEGLKFLIPTLFTGAVLAKTEEQIDQATDPEGEFDHS